MGRKAEGIATNPLATARQLWRLNKDGLLRFYDDEDREKPITAREADEMIRLSQTVQERVEMKPLSSEQIADLFGRAGSDSWDASAAGDVAAAREQHSDD